MSDCPFSVEDVLWVETELALFLKRHGRKKRVGAILVVEMPAKFYFLMLVKAAVNQYNIKIKSMDLGKALREEALDLNQLLSSKKKLDFWPSKDILATLFPKFSCFADAGIDELYPWIAKITEENPKTNGAE